MLEVLVGLGIGSALTHALWRIFGKVERQTIGDVEEEVRADIGGGVRRVANPYRPK